MKKHSAFLSQALSWLGLVLRTPLPFCRLSHRISLMASTLLTPAHSSSDQSTSSHVCPLFLFLPSLWHKNLGLKNSLQWS